MNARKLYSAVVLLFVASLLLSACAAPTPTATSTPPAPTKTPKPSLTPTSTPKPTSTPLPTPTPNLAATKQVDDFTGVIKKYFDAGYISTTNGSYTHLDDATYSWAELNYYQWNETGYSPTDFVITSDVTWKSASAAADSSGCGFVFREQPNGDNYMLFISLKGYLQMSYFLTAKGNYSTSLGRGSYGLPAQTGSAHVGLIAEDNVFRALVNDKVIKVFTGLQGKLAAGHLAYTVVSGTNKSFGTSCDFKNTEMWTIKK